MVSIVNFVLVDGHFKLLSFDQTFFLQGFNDSSECLLIHLMFLVFLQVEFDSLAQLNF